MLNFCYRKLNVYFIEFCYIPLAISFADFKSSFVKTNVFETCISDHHKIISTIMKLHFTRESLKTKYYRDHRKFDFDYFSSGLSRQLDSTFCFIKEVLYEKE